RNEPQNPLQQPAGTTQDEERGDDADSVPEDEFGPAGADQGEGIDQPGGNQERQQEAGPQHVPPSKAAFDGASGRSEQQGRAQGFGALERQEGEGEADQQAEAARGEQRRGVDDRRQA